MDTSSARSVLIGNRLFSGLPDESIEKISALARQKSYPNRSLLFAQGDVGDAFYGIVSGKIRISFQTADGKEMHVVELSAGDTFGEIALIDGGPRTATATTTTSCKLFVIARSGFVHLLDSDAALSKQLLIRLCERVRWTSELVEDLSVLDIPARIAKRICILADSFGSAGPAGIELAISQQDLATFLGLSRQAVNSHLQVWCRQGWLQLKRGRIVILDIDGLQNSVTVDS